MIAKISERDGDLVALNIQLKEALAVNEMHEKTRELQANMNVYFECVHDENPQVGDDLRVRNHGCGDVTHIQWQRSFAGMFIHTHTHTHTPIITCCL